MKNGNPKAVEPEGGLPRTASSTTPGPATPEQSAAFEPDDFGSAQISRKIDVVRSSLRPEEDLQTTSSGRGTSGAGRAQDPPA